MNDGVLVLPDGSILREVDKDGQDEPTIVLQDDTSVKDAAKDSKQADEDEGQENEVTQVVLVDDTQWQTIDGACDDVLASLRLNSFLLVVIASLLALLVGLACFGLLSGRIKR